MNNYLQVYLTVGAVMGLFSLGVALDMTSSLHYRTNRWGEDVATEAQVKSAWRWFFAMLVWPITLSVILLAGICYLLYLAGRGIAWVFSKG